jgi:hypothetical protein
MTRGRRRRRSGEEGGFEVARAARSMGFMLCIRRRRRSMAMGVDA